MKLKLISNTLDTEKVVTMAAKLCYSPVGVDEIGENLTDEQIAKFLGMLVSMGHESPLEHATFTFAVEGISRACSHQLVRHRIASFSQQSQRYVKLDQFEYIIPPRIKGNARAEAIFLEAMESDQYAYNLLVDTLMINILANDYEEELVSVLMTMLEGVSLEEALQYCAEMRNVSSCDGLRLQSSIGDYILDDEFYTLTYGGLSVTDILYGLKSDKLKLYSKIEKMAIEDARYVFPNACETKMVFTMNTRSLYNFFEHRCCERAQWEIRAVAVAMLKEVKKVAPILFKGQGANCVKGACPEGNMTCGNIKEVREFYNSL